MGRLKESTVALLEDLFLDYPDRPAALLSALYVVQSEENHLSEEGLSHLADIMQMPKSVIYETVTFFTLFYRKPLGRHIIRACRNICCYLRGSDQVVARLEEVLGVKAGETTPDGLFTLELSECLGACDQAPMMMIDDRIFGPLEGRDIEGILEEYR
jgi:NADH-quinone oxidoreductase subunit E